MRVSRRAEIGKNTGACVGLSAQDTVTEGLDGAVYPTQPVQGKTTGLVWNKVLKLRVCALVISYEGDSIVGRCSTITRKPLA